MHLLDETTISKDQNANARLAEWHTKDQDELTALRQELKTNATKFAGQMKDLTARHEKDVAFINKDEKFIK